MYLKCVKKADIVVVTYHGGFESDLETGEPTELLTGENEGYAIATKVPGIDALVTGHQHRVIATKVNGVPVIQPGYRGAYVGEICLQVEKKATVMWSLIVKQNYTKQQKLKQILKC